MKKLVALGMMAALVFTLTVACKKSETAAAPAAVQKLKVGMMPFGGNVPAKYAFDQGWFKEAGLDIEFVMFANGAGINEALAAKQVDLGVSGLAMVFSLASGTCTWVAETNTSGGMGIYVRPNSPVLKEKGKVAGKPEMYGTKETLKGLKFLGQLGTSSQYNVICYIRQFGLTEADIQMIHIDLGTDLQAFISGQGDALAASRPFSFQAQAKGYVCAATFEDATDVVLKDGIVVRNEVIEKKRSAVVLFLREYFRAAEAMQGDNQLRFDYSKKYFADNGRTYSDDDMKNEMKAQQYVVKSFMTKPTYKFGDAMLSIADFYSKGGKIPKDNLPNVPKSFDVSLLKDALKLELPVAGK